MSEVLLEKRAPSHPAPREQVGSKPFAPVSAAHGPRRVLYVVSLFPSWSETFIAREIRALIDGGVDVRIVSLRHPAGGPVHADSAALAGRVHRPQRLPVAAWSLFRTLLRYPVEVMAGTATLVRELWRSPVVMLKSLLAMSRGLEHVDSVRAFDPDFIHAHWSTYSSTAAWSVSKVLARPFGFTCHAHDIFVNRHMLPRKIADAALAVTISRHNIDWMARNVCPEARDRFRVVHCGVDLRDIAFRPDERDGTRIVTVGRLAPEKGIEVLIEALALLRDSGREVRSTIIGVGPLRAQLEALIRRRGLGALVSLSGAMPQNEVRAALAEASAFVLPCQVAADGNRDGIPVALMEAMAAGCPVVSCPVSGVPELIEDGVNGLLVPERNPAALARALARLLDDGGMRQRFAAAARQRIETAFDARKEAMKLHQLMTEAVTHGA